MKRNTVHGQAGSGEQVAKQDFTTRESIDKSSGGDTLWKGGAIERKQHPRAWATGRGRTKAIGSEGRRVWMISIIEWRIDSIYGGWGIGGGLESVSVGVEKCVPWCIVRGRVRGRGRGRGVSC